MLSCLKPFRVWRRPPGAGNHSGLRGVPITFSLRKDEDYEDGQDDSTASSPRVSEVSTRVGFLDCVASTVIKYNQNMDVFVFVVVVRVFRIIQLFPSN